MDVTRILEADHRKVEDLFSKIEKAEGAEKRQLVDELATDLKAHMQLEEETLYPQMQPATGKEMAEEGENEHDLARTNLDAVVELAPDDPGFGGALEALKAAIEHHVKDEEDKVFPKLRNDGERILQEIATPFMTKRLALGMPMEAPALAAACSKDELVDEAEKVGVDGAGSMNKDELAEALALAMT